jgi:glycerol-3-phosphate acyltransferase PlsX
MATIVLDAEGGLNAPAAAVAAAALVSMDDATDAPIDLIVIGDAAAIDRELARQSHNAERIRVRPAAFGTSVERAVELVKAGVADALVTAADPPGALRSCLSAFSLIPGVRRAPLCAVYPALPRPGSTEPFALILDVGATLRPTADDLVTWARMGAIYAQRVWKIDAPTVGLLSIGRDPRVGPPEHLEAHRQLEADTSLRYVGTVEGIAIPRGVADVIVCDGFTGQVVVGLLGGVGDALINMARGAYRTRTTWRVGLKLLEGAVVRFHEIVEHNAYGGAPLLGLDRTAILALPSSSPAALASAVRLAARAVRADLPRAMAESLRSPHFVS